MKKIITIIMIFLCLITTGFAALTDDLVAYYKFDGNAVDATGNGYDGINNGAISTSSGKINEAYSFDGVDDYVNIGNINMVSNFTISCWFNQVADDPKAVNILGKANPYFPNGYMIYTQPDRIIYFFGYGLSINQVNTVDSINLNQWYNVVVTYNSTRLNIYLDGVLKQSLMSNGTIIVNSDHAKFAYYKSSNSYWPGQIDEVGIWQRALSAQEVEGLYNSGNGLQYPFQNMGNNLTIGEANLIIDEVFNNEFSNINITNNQILYTSFQSDITTKKTYNRYIETSNKRFAIYYGETPTSSISQDNIFYTLETSYLTETEFRNQLQNLINNS